MNTEAQDELITEMERFARLIERIAADIRRLTAGIKKDLDDCLALASDKPSVKQWDDEGSD